MTTPTEQRGMPPPISADSHVVEGPAVSPLFNESVELRDGHLVIPDRPGTGFTFTAS